MARKFAERVAELVHRATSDRGATAVEYAIMAALVAGVIVAAVAALGQQVIQFFDRFVQTFGPHIH